MKTLTSLLCSLLCSAVVLAQTPPPPSGPPAGGRGGGFVLPAPLEIPLWEDGVPGALGTADADKPTITVYRAGGRANPGTVVIVAPGGAYRGLSMEMEGRQLCYFFNAAGITAVLLKYRLAPYRHPVPLNDAQRAIRIVRSRAAEFGINPERIGMMGFSAGGHLTATAGTQFEAGNASATNPIERVSSRPDFLVLAYPVISFQKSIAGESVLTAYAASGRNLLGETPEPTLLNDLSAELRVTAQTPPTFLFHSSGDTLVPSENSIAFYLALHKAGVPVEMHVFEKGPHGGGLALADPANGEWPGLLLNWMRGRGLFTPAAAPTAP